MLLSGQQIEEEGIIQGYEKENVQQQGIDIRVQKIFLVGISDVGGIIPKHGKTIAPQEVEIHAQEIDVSYDSSAKERYFGWRLEPGYYSVEYIEGCNIPQNRAMKPISRSSLIRCGAEVRSGNFDAGFKTKHMGSYLKVEKPILIERGARIAQVMIEDSGDVKNLYDGQWQGDKQRKE